MEFCDEANDTCDETAYISYKRWRAFPAFSRSLGVRASIPAVLLTVLCTAIVLSRALSRCLLLLVVAFTSTNNNIHGLSHALLMLARPLYEYHVGLPFSRLDPYFGVASEAKGYI